MSFVSFVLESDHRALDLATVSSWVSNFVDICGCVEAVKKFYSNVHILRNPAVAHSSEVQLVLAAYCRLPSRGISRGPFSPPPGGSADRYTTDHA